MMFDFSSKRKILLFDKFCKKYILFVSLQYDSNTWRYSWELQFP